MNANSISNISMSKDQQVLSIIEQFEQFKQDAFSSIMGCTRELETLGIHFYVRKQLRSLTEFHLCIASVCFSESLHGTGAFGEIMTYMEANLGEFDNVEFESVMSDHLKSLLIRHGYSEVSSDGQLPISEVCNLKKYQEII